MADALVRPLICGGVVTKNKPHKCTLKCSQPMIFEKEQSYNEINVFEIDPMDKQFHIFQTLFSESGPGFDYPPEDSTRTRHDW